MYKIAITTDCHLAIESVVSQREKDLSYSSRESSREVDSVRYRRLFARQVETYKHKQRDLPGEKDEGLDGKKFSDGSNCGEFVFRGVVKEYETIQGPALGYVGQYTNIEISALVGEVSFLVESVSFQNHDGDTEKEFQEHVLENPEFTLDEEWGRPVDTFFGTTAASYGTVVVRAGSGGGVGNHGASDGLSHKPRFEAAVLESPHVDPTGRRLVLQQQDESFFATQNLNEEL